MEGRLGGQASVPGAAGSWRDLTDNVNLLAGNLTTQVRAIAEVATAVTQGDLTRSIQVDAKGEVAELKDNINTMIANLRETTERNKEQDWLKTNIARFTSMLQGQRDLFTVGQMLLADLVPLVQAQQGTDLPDGRRSRRRARAQAAWPAMPSGPASRTASRSASVSSVRRQPKKQRICFTDVPPTTPYSASASGRRPFSVIVLPVLFEGKVMAVIELAPPALHVDAPPVPRSVHDEYRRRPQHH